MSIIISIIWLLSFIPEQQKEILVNESFNYPDGPLPSAWWSEGAEARIQDGHLFVDADTSTPRVSTIWLDYHLSGNLQVEFDVKVVSSSDEANNINCFFLYSDPFEKPLRSTAKERESGSYNLYHKLNGYIFTNVTNGNPPNVRVRFRDNPGFHLLGEIFVNDLAPVDIHHIKIVKNSAGFQYWIDDKMILELEDDQFNTLHEEGLFGFRTWHTSLWWDNLIITQLDSTR